MAHSAPGKHYREGLSFIEVADMFPDNLTAERWFVQTRWPDGVCCPACGSLNVQARSKRKPQPFRCRERDCLNDFSVKTGTPMQSSNIGLRKWAIAFYLLSTGIKGVSSMKLHRDLKVTQKTAWFMLHRIRETWDKGSSMFGGPVEIDETFIGGKARNMHAHKREQVIKGRGAVGKTPSWVRRTAGPIASPLPLSRAPTSRHSRASSLSTSNLARRSTPMITEVTMACQTTKPSGTRRRSTSTGRRTRTESRAFGPCSSADTTAPTTG